MIAVIWAGVDRRSSSIPRSASGSLSAGAAILRWYRRGRECAQLPYCFAIVPLTIPKIDDLAAARGSNMISFAGGTPHPKDFPVEALGRYLIETLGPEALAYGPPHGQPSLLAALQRYFADQGIDASPERTTVTSGAIAGLDLVFRCALNPGDVVVVEAPTYSDSLMSLALSRARIVELPMDEEGARVEELPEIARTTGRPKLIYVIPTFHNPTGVTLSARRRERLIELAVELEAILVEDDAYGVFRFSGEPVPALVSLSADVVHVHSLSKVVAPGLRTGCVVGPPPFIETIVRARAGTDICSSTLNQEVVARFINGKAFKPHIARLTKLFAARRDAMLAALDSNFADTGASWTRPEGGMFLWLRFSPGFEAEALLADALDEGVAFVPGNVFSASGQHKNALRLCYGSVEEQRIAHGVRRLRAAYDRASHHRAADS